MPIEVVEVEGVAFDHVMNDADEHKYRHVLRRGSEGRTVVVFESTSTHGVPGWYVVLRPHNEREGIDWIATTMDRDSIFHRAAAYVKTMREAEKTIR